MIWFEFVIAIVLINSVRDIVRLRHKLKEKELALRAKMPQSAPILTDAQANALRDELQQLRDTSTSFCMSLQHTLDRLEQRVAHLENRLAGVDTASTQSPPQQTIGRHGW